MGQEQDVWDVGDSNASGVLPLATNSSSLPVDFGPRQQPRLQLQLVKLPVERQDKVKMLVRWGLAGMEVVAQVVIVNEQGLCPEEEAV